MTTSNFRLRLVYSFFLPLVVVSPLKALAADVRPHISKAGTYTAIVIEGEIAQGDFETFVKIVRENQGKVDGVYLFTAGGDFREAMKIGRAMRALELASQVPLRDSAGRPDCDWGGGGSVVPTPKDPNNCTCASAGFFIHIGGIHRGGTYLAVHRPFFGKGEFGRLSQADAERAFDALQQSARSYMEEMGVPTDIQEDVLGTPSDQTLLLDELTVKTHFWRELPYRHEWIANRCRELSAAEEERLKRDDLRALNARLAEESKCAIEVGRQSRFDAYTKYFGTEPADYGNHDFTKWVQAPRYLGRRFYDLLSEERFEEEKLGRLNFLSRRPTASAPHVSLADSPSTPRVVSWINLVNSSNPSTEFIHRVVTSLNEAWGNSISSGSDEWRWYTNEYVAKLTLEPASASGPFLSLVIEEE